MTPLPPETIEELRRLLSEAIPNDHARATGLQSKKSVNGRWIVFWDSGAKSVGAWTIATCNDEDETALIVAAINNLPALLNERDSLSEVLEGCRAEFNDVRSERDSLQRELEQAKAHHAFADVVRDEIIRERDSLVAENGRLKAVYDAALEHWFACQDKSCDALADALSVYDGHWRSRWYSRTPELAKDDVPPKS